MAKKRVGTMKKPAPEQFGITSQEYTNLVAERTRLRAVLDTPPVYVNWLEELFLLLLKTLFMFLPAGFLILMIYASLGGIAGLFVGWIVGLILQTDYIIVGGIIGGIIGGVIGAFSVVFMIWTESTKPYSERRKRARYHEQLLDPKYQKVALCEDAIRRYEYKQQSYWKSLKGTKFEKALARLYKNMGYSVTHTKGSGDEGIDLILSKVDNKTVVQCKGHKKPVGVGTVRDLYGAMMHFGAESAVLACPAGFTNGVRKFVIGKPIQLLSTTDFVEMAESVDKESANR
ncbi:MAG: restriction endonuclease [Planctomycetes bacterium]|nr:restriction endonuclease [Planctomycetota bacterium]